ncbi:hypothetical protein M426DRAFT_8808 [Hypoxylon sp. CI-4A]|nr:hypothetical protein M426DRAFT_8808 [Hypoxylon sp. CI-4A]
MPTFNCGHGMPKSRVGDLLVHLPQDRRKRCPECQTRTAVDTLWLLLNLRSNEPVRSLDPYVRRRLVTWIFDRFVSQRKSDTNGFKSQFENLLQEWSETCYPLLDRDQISEFSMTVKSQWGSDMSRRTLRQLAIGALRSYDVYELIEPVDAEVLTTLNRTITLFRERASVIETFEQFEILANGAVILQKLRDDVISALSELEKGFSRWDAITAGK